MVNENYIRHALEKKIVRKGVDASEEPVRRLVIVMLGLSPRYSREGRFQGPCSRVPGPRRVCALVTLLIAFVILCMEIRVVTRHSPPEVRIYRFVRFQLRCGIDW